MLYIGLVSLFVVAASYNRYYDDPFITYRYAHKIAHGLGFTYNPWERVLSTTTPLFALILAIFYPLFTDIPLIAKLIGGLSLAIGGIFIWRLSSYWGTPIAGWSNLLLYPSCPLLLATVGSEMPLYLAFCLGALSFYSQQAYTRSALFAALATLTRPDGILIPIILTVDHLRQKYQPLPWKAILVYSILTLPWFVFAQIYFGSPIPATLFAKHRQGLLATSQPFTSRSLELITAALKHWPFQMAMILALLGLAFAVYRSRRWLLFFAWMVLYFIVYSLSGVSGYLWYYAPLAAGFLASMSLGIAALQYAWRSSRNQPIRGISWRAPAQAAVALLCLTPLLLGYSLVLRAYWHQLDPRFPIYRAVGEWIKSNTPTDASVGVLETGIIGYYSQRSMIDFAGLLQPDVAAHLTPETTYEDAAHWSIENYHPDYLVLQSGSFPEIERTYAHQNCRLAKQFPGQTYAYPGVLEIYACDAGQ